MCVYAIEFACLCDYSDMYVREVCRYAQSKTKHRSNVYASLEVCTSMYYVVGYLSSRSKPNTKLTNSLCLIVCLLIANPCKLYGLLGLVFKLCVFQEHCEQYVPNLVNNLYFVANKYTFIVKH